MYIHYSELDLPAIPGSLPARTVVQFKYAEYAQGQWNTSKSANEFFISKNSWNNLIAPLNALITQIPSTSKAWDDKFKVRTIPLNNWAGIKKIAEALGVQVKKWNNLYQDLIFAKPSQNYDNSSRYNQVKIDPSEFFYETEKDTQNAAQGNSNELTREQIEQKLKLILEIDSLTTAGIDLKKLYRKAALKLHPDLNNGDGSKMSELNFIWQSWERMK